MAPRSATKRAGSAATKAKSQAMRQLSETPGVLEEGKIFFLYRCRHRRGRPASHFGLPAPLCRDSTVSATPCLPHMSGTQKSSRRRLMPACVQATPRQGGCPQF